LATSTRNRDFGRTVKRTPRPACRARGVTRYALARARQVPTREETPAGVTPGTDTALRRMTA
jgi:hypothetical protein